MNKYSQEDHWVFPRTNLDSRKSTIFSASSDIAMILQPRNWCMPFIMGLDLRLGQNTHFSLVFFCFWCFLFPPSAFNTAQNAIGSCRSEGREHVILFSAGVIGSAGSTILRCESYNRLLVAIRLAQLSPEHKCTMALSEHQLRTLSIVERCASALSILGVATIIGIFCFSRQFRNPIHRIVFVNAFYNLIDVAGTTIALSGPAAGNHSALCQVQSF
jgi:hypothetical protein